MKSIRRIISYLRNEQIVLEDICPSCLHEHDIPLRLIEESDESVYVRCPETGARINLVVVIGNGTAEVA